jgi:hypothetical protein
MTRDKLNRLLAHKQSLERLITTDVTLERRINAVRLWQAQRLERTYGDLRLQSRFVAALDFFSTDLYGPGDFTRRDADLKRAAARLQRALPTALMGLLCMALELQVLTLELDQQLARAVGSHDIDADSYATAYRKVGRSRERQRQIDLILHIGEALGRLVKQHWIGVALRTAHVPSQIAGFGVLQGFLERGFDAFRQLGDPKELLDVIRERESALMTSLLRGDSALLYEPASGGAHRARI